MNSYRRVDIFFSNYYNLQSVLLEYTVYSPLFSARSLRTSATGSHLDQPCLKVREITIYSSKGVVDGLETPTPVLSVHNNNYKMTASDGKCSILMILRENRAQ